MLQAMECGKKKKGGLYEVSCLIYKSCLTELGDNLQNNVLSTEHRILSSIPEPMESKLSIVVHTSKPSAKDEEMGGSPGFPSQ